MVDKKIVLIGAGSASFGPPTLNDMYQSKVLAGSTISLVDINEEKLNKVYEIVLQENKIKGNKFNIEKTTDRNIALKDADIGVKMAIANAISDDFVTCDWDKNERN